jgi:hypothetical protein
MAGFRAAINTSSTVDIVKWNPAPVEAAVLANLRARQDRAGVIIRDTIKRKLNVGNPTGRYPSAPGEPPRKVSARLYGSITAVVVVDRGLVITMVGTNVEYARRLELGFSRADSKGRVYDQAPRPFMRPGLTEALPRVKAETGLSFRVE